MPKHPHILKRDGRYYYRKRIPADLVQAGCYGNKKEIKPALGTSDLATANRLAITVALQVDEEFRAKRRELAQAGKIAPCCNSESKRRLADVSAMELNDFIMRIFINCEKREAGSRRTISDPNERQEILDIAQEDLGDMAGDLYDSNCNWIGKVRKALEAAGISTEGADYALLTDLAAKLQRAEVEAMYRSVEALSGHPHASLDPLFTNVHADSPLPTMAKPSKTIDELCADYMAHNLDKVKKGNLAQSTISKIQMRCRILTDFFSKGKSLATFTREDADRLVDFLPTIPQNAAKRYKGVSLVTAVEKESCLPEKRLVHSETAEDYLTGLSAMLTHAVERGWLKENPLKERLVRERLAKSKKRVRQTLTPDEMTKVFASTTFLSQRYGGKETLEARYWVPLLCLFHGTRSNEVAGMLVSEVENVDGVDILNLRENSIRRLKNKTSERLVPLHQKLIEMGFLKFVAKRRKEDPTGPLFPGLSSNRNGSRSDGVSKWWQRLVEGMFGAAPTDGAIGARGLHSLRHSWVAAALAIDMNDTIRKRLGGWAQTNASEGYGRSGAMKMLKTAIDKIEFPGVRFPTFRRIERN